MNENLEELFKEYLQLGRFLYHKDRHESNGKNDQNNSATIQTTAGAAMIFARDESLGNGW